MPDESQTNDQLPEGAIGVPGIFLRARVILICAGCVSKGRVEESLGDDGCLVQSDLANSDPSDAEAVDTDMLVECPRCSREAGHKVGVPVAVLAGDQVLDVFPDDGEDDDAGDEPGEPVAEGEVPPDGNAG